MMNWIKIKDGLYMKPVGCGNLYVEYNNGFWDTSFCNGEVLTPTNVHSTLLNLGVAKSNITRWYNDWQTATADNHIGTYWYRFREHGATRVWKFDSGLIKIDFVYANLDVGITYCSRPYVRPIAELDQYRSRPITGLKEGRIFADLWAMRH